MEICVLDKEGKEIAKKHSDSLELNLTFEHTYEEGDSILIKGCKGSYVCMTLDASMGESLVYMTGDFRYPIPTGEKKQSLPPHAFSTGVHNIRIRKAKGYEVDTYRNLACNVYDYHDNSAAYPHASANVETRGESVFAARNAIDGMTANEGHGMWPYSSWGINRDPEAVLHLDFGRPVVTDSLVVYLRADFPHDSWWTDITVRFSDGSTLTAPMKKTEQGQTISFEKKTIEWLELCDLKKADDESPFPALTQLMVMGWEQERR